jgi:hypothetical protein
MPLCLAAGALAATLAAESFTLAWTHSIEKIRWEEDWRIEARGLQPVEARIRGAGAGMEPPAGSVFEHGVWRYRPQVPPLPRVLLAHSPHAAPYELCTGGRCASIAQLLPGLPASATIELSPCPPPSR